LVRFLQFAIDTGGAPCLAKIRSDLNNISGAWGKMIHEKKTEAKNLVTLSLYETGDAALRVMGAGDK
jgi:hypothetical protein